MTVYVDIAGTKVGDPVAIELKRGDAKLSVPGKIATDEMSGFLFAEAKGPRSNLFLHCFGRRAGHRQDGERLNHASR
jgi:hypothetical protein